MNQKVIDGQFTQMMYNGSFHSFNKRKCFFCLFFVFGSGLPVRTAARPQPQAKPQVFTQVKPQGKPQVKHHPKPYQKKQQKKGEKSRKTFTEKREMEVWVEGQTDDGHTYYYNTTTGGKEPSVRMRFSHTFLCFCTNQLFSTLLLFHFIESQWEKPMNFQGESLASEPPVQTEVNILFFSLM